MKKICVGDKYQIHCYKHTGKIHRIWDEAVVLDMNKDYIVFGNNKTKVTESQGTWWRTKEPAILYFKRNSWYNVISQLKKDGVYYYCNIATPFIIEEGTIKYIDYDLDLRIFPSKEYKVLDRLEYDYHKRIMHYSDDLDTVIQNALSELISEYENNNEMFNDEKNKEYGELYFKLKEEEKNSNF